MKHSEMGYILRISRCFDIYRRTHMKDVDLNPPLLMCVSQICRSPGLSQDQLSESLCIDKTTTSHHVAKLERLGYLTREVSATDARFRQVYPTEKALALAPGLHQSFVDFYTALVKDLTPKERESLSGTLEKMLDHAVQMTRKDLV